MAERIALTSIRYIDVLQRRMGINIYKVEQIVIAACSAKL